MDEPFDKETFDAVLASATRIRQDIHNDASININKAQKKQKKDFDRRHLSASGIKVGDNVLLRNNKQNDRKGFCFLTFGLERILWKILPQKGWLP